MAGEFCHQSRSRERMIRSSRLVLRGESAMPKRVSWSWSRVRSWGRHVGRRGARVAVLAPRPDPARQREAIEGGLDLPHRRAARPRGGGGRPPAFEATAVYFAGRLYVSTPYGKVIALEPETGKERWAFDAQIDRNGQLRRLREPRRRGLAGRQQDAAGPCRERIFFASIDARLFALDAATGVAVRATSGRRADRPQDGPAPAARSTPASTRRPRRPAVVDDLVIVGSAIADNHRADSPTRRGAGLRRAHRRAALDLGPAAREPETRAAPTPGRGSWSIPSAIWSSCRRAAPAPTTTAACGPATTATPTRSSRCARRPGEMVVALPDRAPRPLGLRRGLAAGALQREARTARDVAAVAVGSKTGHLFLLDRETGRAALPRGGAAGAAERRAGRRGRGDAARSRACPPPLVPQRLTADGRLGRDRRRPPVVPGADRRPALRGDLHAARACAARSSCPATSAGCTGAASRSTPSRGLLIAPTNRLAAVVRLVPQDRGRRLSQGASRLRDDRGSAARPTRCRGRSCSRRAACPATRRPSATLAAVDVATGQIRWEVPLGKLPVPGALPEWGSVNLGGPLATAGGLVFIGAALRPGPARVRRGVRARSCGREPCPRARGRCP